VDVTILADAPWLVGRERNDFSQFGEDGLIEAVFEQIGETNRWCFEVGASNGESLSNTKRWRDLGWSAVLIEADGVLAQECRRFESDCVKVVHERIGGDVLDRILRRAGMPKNPDLGIIDIDGQDYWAWKALVCQPRVMLVEFAYWNPPGTVPVEGSTDAQSAASFDVIVGLGVAKGYTPVARTYCNVLFVDKDAWRSN
jgi:hypothetical protein